MFEELDDIKQYGSIGLIVVSLMAIFMSGIFFGVLYYTMDVTETALKSNDCVIQDNVYVDSCQDLWDLSVYPFLAMREILIWMSFFFIFALVLGMMVAGYQSGKSPALMGVLILFVSLITYAAIEFSNVYRTMLENEVFRNMMTEFTIYNKIMLSFPYFAFFVGLFAVLLSIVNYQKTNVNRDSGELNY